MRALQRFLLLIVLWFVAAVSSAAAQGPVPLADRLCSLSNDGSVTAQQAVARATDFNCEKSQFNTPARHYWVRAEIADITPEIASPVLRLRVARQNTITAILEFEDGETETLIYGSDEIKASWRSPTYASFPLTQSNGKIATSLLIGVERPWDPWNLADLNIISAEADLAEHHKSYLANAVFCALLAAPLLLHICLFFVLRVRFILIHVIALTATIVMQVLWGGVIFDIAPFVSVNGRSILAHLCIALIMAAICLLIRDICEPGKLSPRLSNMLLYSSIFSVTATSLIIAISPRLPVIGSILFHLVVLVCVIAVVTSLASAAFKGSWTARGLCLGTVGFVFIALARIINSTGLVDNVPTFDHGLYAAAFVDAVVMSAIVVHRAFKMRREHELAVIENTLLFKAARIDPLTELLNRRALEEDFETLLSQKERRRNVYSMLIIDVDHFKTVNDTFGHDGGDLCLKQISALFRSACRPDDLCARIGGEEFVFILSTPTPDDALSFAERLRERVSQFEFGEPNAPIGRLTISVGVTDIPRGPTIRFEDVYQMADKALYTAKKTGRNRVINAANMTNISLAKRVA